MDKLITLYHGSKQIVEVPTFGLGRKNNDFGLGFYCTESINLAKEWAVSSLNDGFASRYTLDTGRRLSTYIRKGSFSRLPGRKCWSRSAPLRRRLWRMTGGSARSSST